MPNPSGHYRTSAPQLAKAVLKCIEALEMIRVNYDDKHYPDGYAYVDCRQVASEALATLDQIVKGENENDELGL